PTARNKNMPQTMVSATANSGDNHAITADGRARRSSLSMSRLGALRPVGCAPKAAHPATDQIKGGVGGSDRGRETALGKHDQTVGNFEQLVNFLGDKQDCASSITQRQEFRA